MQRWIYLVMWPQVFFLSWRNIQVRVFRANIFKSECFVQKYWSGTVTRYSVMRGCLFGSDQTKYYVHGCNFHSFSGPFIHKKWAKIDELYDRRQVSYFTMKKKCIFWVLCRNITFSCRNITMWPAFTPTFLCGAIFRGCAKIFISGRHIHLCAKQNWTALY